MDITSIFALDTPIIEIIIRGTCMYLGLYFLLRIIVKRQSGGVGINNLLVLVLLADAAQNGMADNYTSVTDGLLLVVVIIFWSFLLDWLSYRFPVFDAILKPKRLLLVKDGRILSQNLRRELITNDELLTELRAQGIEKPEQVAEASMEPDGRVSVVPRSGKEANGESHSAKDRHEV